MDAIDSKLTLYISVSGIHGTMILVDFPSSIRICLTNCLDLSGRLQGILRKWILE